MKLSKRVAAILGLAPLLAGLATLGSCQTPPPVSQPRIKTVFIILMENKNWVQIAGSGSAPYINNTLLPMASHAELYFNPPLVHPSLPNYLWLEAGVNFGIFNDDPPSANHQSTTNHLVTLLQKSGISWKTYQENIGGADILLVRLPGNAALLQQGHQMVGRTLVVRAGRVVVEDAEVDAGLEPQIVGQAGMNQRRIEVQLSVGRHRQQGIVDVGGAAAA